MMRTLRKKFILFAMSAVTVLLFVLVGAINGISWIMLDSQTDRILDNLIRSDGMSGQMHFREQPMFMPRLNMDTMQSARFFTVDIDEDGNIVRTNTERISSVDDESARTFAKEVTARGKTSGKRGSYKFKVIATEKGTKMFFMDMSSATNMMLTVIVTSCAIALICWLISLLFVALLSEKVVRPIVANMEKQKQFITNAGHELNTPLAIIQSNNDAMALINGENKYTQNIRTQTRRLGMLMSNLLTLSKLDEEVKLSTEQINISELISDFIPTYAEAAEEKGITFSSDIAPNVCATANRDMFLQFISSIFDNALKYTNEGGQIRVSLTAIGHKVQLIEENTCNSLGNCEPERLFERFYRGDSARTQSGTASGYGIGLSAARAVCESMGGRLYAEYPTENTIRFTAEF